MLKFRSNIWLGCSAFLIVCCLTIGIISEKAAKNNALVDFPPTGKIINIGERNIHLNCKGKGKPIVVFESGLDTSGSLSWSMVHDEIAKTTRACSYDRAGMMWSDLRYGYQELIGKAIAEDLNKALLNAGENPPYVLVGHSFGGPYITIFTKYFGSSVAGLVFVDTSHPDQVEIFKEYKEPFVNLILYAVMDFFEPIWSDVGLTRYFAESNDDRLINQSLKDEQATDAYSPSSGLALTKESQSYVQTLNEAGSFRSFGDRPLFVIGALSNYDKLTDVELSKIGLNRHQIPLLIQKDISTHKDQASWSTNSELTILYDTGHYVQFEKPAVVINSVKSVIYKVRLEGSERTVK